MKKILCGCMAGVLLLCSGCGAAYSGDRQGMPMQSVDTAMGTIVSQTIYSKTENNKITSDIHGIIRDLETNTLSVRLDTSELYEVNEGIGQQKEVMLSEELAEYLEQCLAVSEASEGAFDITVGEVVRLWNIDNWAGAEALNDYVLPDEEAIYKGLEQSGYEKLQLDEKCLSASVEMQLDLGAVGKGIALDRLKEYLEGCEEVSGAVISVGGSVLTYGVKADGAPWRVAVVNPVDTSKSLGYLELQGQWCISTSGDYERFVEINGVRYHHIIDPDTGYPADSGLRSVTILSRDGLLSDALSTACFILGQEKGQELAEAYDAEAMFVNQDGTVAMTEGMRRCVHLYD